MPATPEARWPFLVLAGLLGLLVLALCLWAMTRRRRNATPPDHDPAAERELVPTTGPAGS